VHSTVYTHAVLKHRCNTTLPVLPPSDAGRQWSLFVSARALGALVSTLHRQGYLPTIPHFVLLLLGLCQLFIILAMTWYPELLPQRYYCSIIRWSLYYSEEKLEVGEHPLYCIS